MTSQKQDAGVNSQMVEERVAHALLAVEESWNDHTWDQLPENVQDLFRRNARAALAAIAPDDRLREALEVALAGLEQAIDDAGQAVSNNGYVPIGCLEVVREALSLPLNKDRQTLCNDGSCTKPEPHIQGAAGCVFAPLTHPGCPDNG